MGVILTKEIPVCVTISGKTAGYERIFLKILQNQLLSHRIKLLESNQSPITLLFCPIASRMGSDIETALDLVSGNGKVLLVIMHLGQEDQTFMWLHQQINHPVVALTVHTWFTLQAGFYPCKTNNAALSSLLNFFVEL